MISKLLYKINNLIIIISRHIQAHIHTHIHPYTYSHTPTYTIHPQDALLAKMRSIDNREDTDNSMLASGDGYHIKVTTMHWCDHVIPIHCIPRAREK